MQLVEVEEVEGPITEEPSVFFRSLGAVCFSAPDASGQQLTYDGNARVVSATASAGVVFFADSTGAIRSVAGISAKCLCHIPRSVPVEFTAVPSKSLSSIRFLLAGLFVARLSDLLAAATVDDEDT